MLHLEERKPGIGSHKQSTLRGFHYRPSTKRSLKTRADGGAEDEMQHTDD